LRTKKARLGTAWFIKVFIFSGALPKIIEFVLPKEKLQIKVVRELTNTNQFVSYIDAIGELDGVRCVMDWKTTASRYPDEPAGLLSLDPQLICYSWITGISEVALVVFVGKHRPEIQYLKTSISEEQRSEFGRLLAATISQIESAQFPAHSGIRFPQNGCVSCSHMGLCLDDPKLIDANLIRATGGNDLAWLDDPVD
jgi:PD-(D/E)XK nuclease superfamily